MEQYFTVEELAKYLHYSDKTIYKWVINEEIPFFKINQTIRFCLSDIEKWLEKNKKGFSSISKITVLKVNENNDLFSETKNVETSELETSTEEE